MQNYPYVLMLKKVLDSFSFSGWLKEIMDFIFAPFEQLVEDFKSGNAIKSLMSLWAKLLAAPADGKADRRTR